MVDVIKNEYIPTDVSPPGETLRDVLAERTINQAELAQRMGRPKKTISEIVNGKAAIIPETALELELVLGIPADFWNAREREYRAHLARKAQSARLAKAASWCKNFPTKQMRELGWISDESEPEGTVKSLLEFFGVATADQWEELELSYAAMFRKPKKFQVDQFALAAWLRRGVVVAEGIRTEEYEKSSFVTALERARRLTQHPPEVFTSELRNVCAKAGVAVAFVPGIPKSRASGATRWLSPNKALIQLSLRYRTDDQLWFTFFHEAAHVLLHAKKLIFLEGEAQAGAEESQANQWAADFLIPPDEFATLEESTAFDAAYIRRFANRIGIAPGIVVGRLQHADLLPRNRLNSLKRRLQWVKGSNMP